MDRDIAIYTTDRRCCTGEQITRRIDVPTMMKRSIGPEMWVRSNCCGKIHRAERTTSPE